MTLSAAASVLAALSACGHPEPSFTAEPGKAREALAYALAEPDLASKRHARWWSLPDGKVPGPSEYVPCSDCHDEDMEVDPKVRKLTEEHEATVLVHGDGKVWCLDCHAADDRDVFVAGGGEQVGAERADRTCARCHGAIYRDFEHGVHGKRLGSYAGKRVLSRCVACHDPHAPALAPRRPIPPPTGGRSAAGAR